GKTERVQIGGTGRCVTGRFLAPAAREPVDWSKQTRSATLSLKLTRLPQPTGLDADSLERWKAVFWQSESGWARMRGSRSFPFEVAADGSFAVDDVPPGTYILSAQMVEAPVATAEPDALKRLGSSSSIEHEIIVPDA